MQTAAVGVLKVLQLCSQEKPAFCKDLVNLLMNKSNITRLLYISRELPFNSLNFNMVDFRLSWNAWVTGSENSLLAWQSMYHTPSKLPLLMFGISTSRREILFLEMIQMFRHSWVLCELSVLCMIFHAFNLCVCTGLFWCKLWAGERKKSFIIHRSKILGNNKLFLCQCPIKLRRWTNITYCNTWHSTIGQR